MKKKLHSSIAFIAFLFFSSLGMGQTLENDDSLKIAILYNESYNEYTQDLPRLFLEEVQDVSNIDTTRIPYTLEDLPSISSSLSDYDIVIGPTDSESMKRICDHLKCVRTNLRTNFVAPLVSAWPDNYEEVTPFVIKTSADIKERVEEVSNELKKLSIESVGIIYEDERWGNSIKSEFIESENFKLMLMPVKPDVFDNYEGFIQSLAENSVQTVILAPHKVKRLKYFLENLERENRKFSRLFNKYKPIIYLLGDYRIEVLKDLGIDMELINQYRVFGITESYFLDKRTEEQVNYITLGKVFRYAMREDFTTDEVINSIKGFFLNGDATPLDIPREELLTWRTINLVDGRRNDLLTTYRIRYQDNSIKKELVEYFADEDQRRSLLAINDEIVTSNALWSLIPEPFKREFERFYDTYFVASVFFYNNISGYLCNVYFWFLLLPFSFLTHLLYVKRISFRRGRLLLRSTSFWGWYLGNMLLTVFLIVLATTVGPVISDVNFMTIFLFAVGCPLGFITLVDKVKGIPVIGNNVNSLISDLQITLDTTLDTILKKNNMSLEDEVNDLAKNNSMFQIRSTTFDLIFNVSGSTLRNVMHKKLKLKIEDIEDQVKVGNIEDNEAHEVKKRTILRFYLRFLYYLYGKNYQQALKSSGLK